MKYRNINGILIISMCKRHDNMPYLKKIKCGAKGFSFKTWVSKYNIRYNS